MREERDTHLVEVLGIRDETPDAKTYDFEVKSGHFDFLPGQEVKLYADTPPKKSDWRFYSLASSPLKRGQIQLTIKHEGGAFAPHFLSNARVGDRYVIDGPVGKFLAKGHRLISEGRAKTMVLLAASSGISPFKSLIEYSVDKALDLDIILMHSVKTRNDWIYKSVLPRLLEKCDRLRLVYAFTRERESLYHNDFNGYPSDRFRYVANRRFQLEDVVAHVPDYADSYYAICGGITFIGGIKAIGEPGMLQKLIKGGVPRESIEIVSFGAK